MRRQALQLAVEQVFEGGQVLCRPGQHGGGLLQRQPERPQAPDPVQPPHILLRVAAVPGGGAFAGGEQADVVVVVQRAHRNAGGLRQFTDAPAPRAVPNPVHAAMLEPDATAGSNPRGCRCGYNCQVPGRGSSMLLREWRNWQTRWI
jgi:hypothetical protein